jgi:predicted secreted protein
MKTGRITVLKIKTKHLDYCIAMLLLFFINLTLATPIVIAKAKIASNAQWEYTFGGTGSDGGRSVIQTTDGGFAIAGWTNSYGAGGMDIWLVKTDSEGQEQWNNTFGGILDEYIPGIASNSLIQTPDEGFVLLGTTSSYGVGGVDMWLVKTDSEGQAQWNNTFGGASDESAGSLIQTTDGGFVLIGSTESYGAGSTDGWLIKTDANGQAQWNKTFGGLLEDELNFFIQTTDGGYALIGYTRSYGAGEEDGWLIKTDANGQAQWNKTFGGLESDATSFLTLADDGGYLIVGATESYSWWIKTDANGQAQWNKTYRDPLNTIKSLIKLNEGGYALTGFSTKGEEDQIEEDCWLAKIDENGQIEWEKTFGGPKTDVGYDLIQTTDGELILTGETSSKGAGEGDMWLLKTSASKDKPMPYDPSFQLSLFAVICIILLTSFYRKKRMK